MSTTPLDVLLARLRDRDKNVRVDVALQIGKLADITALNELIRAIRTEDDAYVRETLSWAIVKMGSAAIPPLVLMLADSDATIRHQGVHVLGKLGESGTFLPLLSVLHDEDANVRQKAAHGLGELGDISAISHLIGLLGDSSDIVQSAVALALEKFGDASVNPLAQVLQDPHWQARAQAASILGLIGSATAVSSLVAAISDSHADVRLAAVSALASIGTDHAQSIARQALGDQDKRVDAIARHILSRA